MKKIFIVVMALMLSACSTLGDAIENMSDQEKQTALIVGSILVAGVIISNNDSNTVIRQCHGHKSHCDQDD